jgi:nucleoside-diphosphate-sugar epimerase
MLIGRIRDKTLKYVTDHTRDFIHVDDICSAIIKNLDNSQLNGIIDVGTGTGVKIDELVNNFYENKLPKVNGHSCEAKENVADTEALLKTGWRPKYNIQDYIKDIV